MLFKTPCKQNFKVPLFFLLSLSFGMTGIIVVKNFKFSIEKTINEKSKNLLGADLALSLITPLEEKELKKKKGFFEGKVEISESIELLTMVKAGNKAKLVQVKGVDQLYPFMEI